MKTPTLHRGEFVKVEFRRIVKVTAFYAASDCDAASLLLVTFEDSSILSTVTTPAGKPSCNPTEGSASRKFLASTVLALDASDTTAILQQREWAQSAIQKSPYGCARIAKYGQFTPTDGFALPFPDICNTTSFSLVRYTIFRNGLCISPEFGVSVEDFRYVVDWESTSLQDCSSPVFAQVWGSTNFNYKGGCEGTGDSSSYAVIKP
jgi:hypothetical protein